MTAELALGLPLVLAVTVGLVWLLAAASAQIRVVDAARESARAVARGDSESEARAVASQIAPDGGDGPGRRSRAAGSQSRPVPRSTGPGGLFDFLPGVTVKSTAVAVLEES